jgi:hypothetical protein
MDEEPQPGDGVRIILALIGVTVGIILIWTIAATIAWWT